MKKRYFFDVSSLRKTIARYPAYSGIQRVVTSITAEIAKKDKVSELFISYVNRKNEIMAMPLLEMDADIIIDPDKMRDFLGVRGDPRIVREILQRYVKRPDKYYYNKIKLDIMSLIGRSRSFNRYGIAPKDWRFSRWARRPDKGRLVPRSVEFMHGDTLILMDSSWDANFGRAFRRAGSQGCRIVSLVHDLIPLDAPWSVDSSMSRIFSFYIEDVLGYSDIVVANSIYTKQQIDRYLGRRGKQREVSTVRLAQSALSGSLKAPISSGAVWTERADGDVLQELFAGRLMSASIDVRTSLATPFALCVGTIEARKNVWRLAVAYKRLIDMRIPNIPRLIFVGKPGLGGKPFFDLMNSTGNLQGFVTVLHDASDAELAVLYDRALFTVMPSLAEGWGLPVGEALSYGKAVLASSSSSLPEVGEDLVLYCNPESIEDITEKLLLLVSNKSLRSDLESKARNAKLRDWAAVADDFMRVIEADISQQNPSASR